eukprot:TRINITY_DN1793_c0_g1_i2.p1 TRINITY_DN1793_c0_g1~~TRINITY_DN1793_c0_g1_i2.p1  ORF type:complete len:127 (+),score=33.41 TRINITY_DN1793_c0_g1_i2:115-495(+)
MSWVPHTDVSINPYFEVIDLEGFKKWIQRAYADTKTAPGVVYYGYTISEDGRRAFCREMYKDADGAVAHLGAVSKALEELSAFAKIISVEFHGPAAEVAKFKESPASKAVPFSFFINDTGSFKAVN